MENMIIKFMIDGVFLKEIESDFFLLKYFVILIDEVYEWSVFIDIFFGFFFRIVLMCKN